MSAQPGLTMILVRDVPRSKTFYTELLGLNVVAEFSGDDFVLLHSPLGGSNIALQNVEIASYGAPLVHGGIILGFMVEDADAVWRDWQTKSVEALSEVSDMGAGRMFTARDPEGHFISVYHLYPQVLEMQKQMGLL